MALDLVIEEDHDELTYIIDTLFRMVISYQVKNWVFKGFFERHIETLKVMEWTE